MSFLWPSGRSRHGTLRSIPYFSDKAPSTLPWYSVCVLAHGTTAPSLTLRSSFGTTSAGSISSRLPSPSHRSQAPCGLLTETVPGCISATAAPRRARPLALEPAPAPVAPVAGPVRAVERERPRLYLGYGRPAVRAGEGLGEEHRLSGTVQIGRASC